MIAVILQARINSTRLPGKALMDLDGKPLLVRVMESLAGIRADRYILACDPASEPPFAPLAKACGYNLFVGDPDDVLDRYCSAIRTYRPDIVVRATGDNPFVFADAAQAALERFSAQENDGASYFGFDGLPYGSGVEILNARDLLDAAERTRDAFDREHVGPALYNHQDRYRCIREPAPAPWRHPAIRLTVDTREDYDRVCVIHRILASRGVELPAPSSAILEAARCARERIVLVPAVGRGKGSGHLVRCAELARNLRTTHCVSLLHPEGARALPADLEDLAITSMPTEAGLVVADRYRSTREEMRRLLAAGPVVALDDGGTGRALADYCIDTIPSLGFSHRANVEDPAFLHLPAHRKTAGVEHPATAEHPATVEHPATGQHPATVEHPAGVSVLVSGGGRDEAGYARPAAEAAARIFSRVTLIAAGGAADDNTGYETIPPIPNLREHLADYDLVITHYGLTAFEALAAGCRVILFSPTRYHWRLARRAGFAVMPPGKPTFHRLQKILRRALPVPALITPETRQRDLAACLANLAEARRIACPFCGSGSRHAHSVHRRETDTMMRCTDCGMLHVSFQTNRKFSYTRSYFFDEYRSQYGKTYLDDFDTIRNFGRERMAVIDRLQKKFLPVFPDAHKRLFDIGCAYGPFLAAAKEYGWIPSGTDISEDAVEWVRDNLSVPAVRSAFPAFADSLLSDYRPFAAVTLWYVIEHFEDLEPVFTKIRQLLIPGGILAFSTPSASGISARKNRRKFFDASPADHFTLWEPGRVRKQLERYGFRTVRIRTTGHHPERFPGCTACKPDTLLWNALLFISRLFRLGDTFEVYAIKRGTLEDAQ